jgi:hypothetical protein
MLCDERLAGCLMWCLMPPLEFNMRIHPAIRKCVVYLGIERMMGEVTTVHYGGTGFFLGVPSQKIPNGTFSYLVTAKHVSDHFNGKSFYIRANLVQGGLIQLQGAVGYKWFNHPTDPAADVAICRISPDPKWDYLGIPQSMIITEKDRTAKGIGIGDEIFVTGLFVYHQGNRKNIPIIRVGNIAMIPDERIPVAGFGEMEAYLVEMRSIGGLSGSPVFTTKQFDEENMTTHLLGLIQGHWDVKPETITDGISQDAGIRAGVNVGIAIVTPASKILEILHCEELVAEREKAEEDWLAKNSPKPD